METPLTTKKLLTKSRFKTGSECATKLCYSDNKDYGNLKSDDAFLKALAEGGFQVGELAKIYHPEGIEVHERDYHSSVTKTNQLLSTKNASIFEAAVRHYDLFVRVDILNKRDQNLEIIEVKAKSFDTSDEKPFFTKKGTIRSEWEPYLLDLAFQTYVVSQAYPDLKIQSFLMLADKNTTASIDGVNQRFLITKDDNGKTSIKVRPGTNAQDIGDRLLCKINVDEEVNYILHKMFGGIKGWETKVQNLAKLVTNAEKASPILTSDCKHCEFRTADAKFPGKKSGFEECWKTAGLSSFDVQRPMVFDIWNFRKSQDLIDSKRYFLDQVAEHDIGIKDGDDQGLSSSQRQWLQVTKAKQKDQTPYVNLQGLAEEFRKFRYPLHFIDFETTMTALPFNKGRRPYEQIAFQFSHHVVKSDGTIEHKAQFIHREKGTFPNFIFLRELKKSLEQDQGSIFRYSNHENTVLRQIRDQILASTEPIADSEALVAWIDSVTTFTEGKVRHEGPRSMIDLCDLVKKYYYSPHTNGSNSIKKVLPAILKDSEFLRQKYGSPIYGSQNGSQDGPTSQNYSKWTWLQLNSNNEVIDPYKLLPRIFTEQELETIEPMVNASEIADGGTAMTAYALMHFSEMSAAEATKIQDALLKYCELDTFAMVMIYEYWHDLIRHSQAKSAA